MAHCSLSRAHFFGRFDAHLEKETDVYLIINNSTKIQLH